MRDVEFNDIEHPISLSPEDSENVAKLIFRMQPILKENIGVTTVHKKTA